jgi:hypothetical protein
MLFYWRFQLAIRQCLIDSLLLANWKQHRFDKWGLVRTEDLEWLQELAVAATESTETSAGTDILSFSMRVCTTSSGV